MASTKPMQTALQPLRRKAISSASCQACSRTRPFSSSRPSEGANPVETRQRSQFMLGAMRHTKQGQLQPGNKSRLRTIGSSQIPDDLGLVPGTFVKPTWSNLPSWLSDPKKRARLEWHWLKNRAQGVLSTYTYCRWMTGAPKIPMRLKERRLAAMELHKKLYTAIAEGDKQTIRDITCKTLQSSLLNQIALRPANDTPKTWSLKSYSGVPVPTFTPFPIPTLIPFSSVRVVSDRCVSLPMGKHAGIRQVIVRISSKQEKTHGNDVKEWRGTEYIVIQRMRLNGKEEEKWKIWGTVNESNWDEVEEKLANETPEPSMMERMRDLMPGEM